LTQPRKDIHLLEGAIVQLKELYRLIDPRHRALVQDAGRMLVQYHKGIDTAFSQWIRANKKLDSIQAGLSIQNIDWLIHQYKAVEDKNGPRTLNNLMLLEEKAWGARPSFAQDDTLLVFDRMLKRVCKVLNKRNRAVIARYYGFHVLTFSKGGPLDSDNILWDQKAITVEQLEDLLLFNLHPESLLPRDVSERRHHANKAANTPLFDPPN
jgi:hypothetical protein